LLVQETRHLRALTIYHSGATGSNGLREWPVVDASFLDSCSTAVGSRLHKLEISGILMSISSVRRLTEGFPELRDLVLHLGYARFDPVELGAALALLTDLRTLHIQCQRTDVTLNDAMFIANQCSRTLRQIGLRNQVWLVRGRGDGEELRFVETAEAFGAFRRSRYGAEDDSAALEDE